MMKKASKSREKEKPDQRGVAVEETKAAKRDVQDPELSDAELDKVTGGALLVARARRRSTPL